LACFYIKFCRNVFSVLTFKGERPIIIIQLNPGCSKITSPTGSGTLTGTTEGVIQYPFIKKGRKVNDKCKFKSYRDFVSVDIGPEVLRGEFFPKKKGARISNKK
jgi:hypothetical protein